MDKQYPTRAELLARYEHNKLTNSLLPKFKYKKQRRKQAGWKDSYGYRWVYFNGQNYLKAMLIYIINTNKPPPECVWYLDQDPSNLHPANLRYGTTEERAQARPSWGRFGIKGAYWDAKAQSWWSQVSLHGKTRYLGEFPSASAAAKAYEEAVDLVVWTVAVCRQTNQYKGPSNGQHLPLSTRKRSHFERESQYPEKADQDRAVQGQAR